jgi:hypothetical protein
MKSGSLNLLGPSGTVQACNAIVLPLSLPLHLSLLYSSPWNLMDHDSMKGDMKKFSFANQALILRRVFVIML